MLETPPDPDLTMMEHRLAESGIYEIVNLVNGKRYVGSALNFTQRWHGHRSRLRKQMHHSEHLQSAWNKYGEAAFEFRILEGCAREKLLEREQHHIDQGCHYNKSLTAGSPLGVKHSDEARANMSASRRGKAKSEQHRKSMSECRRGKMRPEVGVSIRADWEKRKRDGYRHPPLTDEQREKQSKGVKASYTPELRRLRSEWSKAMWAARRTASS